MKTLVVEDSLYGALEAAARREGKSIQDLHVEAIESWLADAETAGQAGSQTDEQGGSESAVTSGVHPVDQFCGLLDGTDFPFLKDGDVDGYIEAIRGR